MVTIETMQHMATRLSGTGGGAQADAVIKAIEAIKNAPGILDARNRMTALYHLSVAISGERHAVDAILDLAEMFED